MAKEAFHIRNYNDDFLLISSADTQLLRQLGKAIYKKSFDFVSEVIVCEHEICIQVNNAFEEANLELLLEQSWEKEERLKTYRLPVHFSNHDDWEAVKEFSGLEKEEVVEKLQSAELEIAMFGFLPGFTYIEGVEARLQIPRKAVPAKRVDRNSIALGGKYLGLYAVESPGGWHVIGKTPIEILDLSSLPPVIMNVGDRLVIESIDQVNFHELLEKRMTFAEYNKEQ